MNSANASLKLAPMFSSHMVLQRGKPVRIWGMALPRANVEVSLAGRDKTATADRAGRWLLEFSALKSGGPFSISVSSEDVNIVLDDILIGDVWICSGQSNMEMMLKDSLNAQEEISSSEFPMIRHCRIPQDFSDEPQDGIACQWRTCNTGSSGEFTAAGYFFARRIHKETGVPIGLLNTSWGGSEIEPWIPGNVFEKRQFRIYMDRQKNALASNSLKRHGLSTHYNAMVHGLTRFPVKGFLWYQGESNACWAEAYSSLFPELISAWRRAWRDRTLPFYFVQLAGFGTAALVQENICWPELREAQAMALRIRNTGMAVAIDVGEAENIHPRNKQEIGRRLALLALSGTYRKKIQSRGPSYSRHRFAKSAAEIFFKDVEKGLCAGKNGNVRGFLVAGRDRKFVEASAEISGKRSVRVFSPLVSKPVAVRYAWTGFPVCNLSNSAGLPAVPFRTDRWPLATKGKMWPE